MKLRTVVHFQSGAVMDGVGRLSPASWCCDVLLATGASPLSRAVLCGPSFQLRPELHLQMSFSVDEPIALHILRQDLVSKVLSPLLHCILRLCFSLLPAFKVFSLSRIYSVNGEQNVGKKDPCIKLEIAGLVLAECCYF